MKILQIILYVLLIPIFAGSIYLSELHNNYTWFGRCGSLITVIPIIISILDFYSDREAIFFAKHNYMRIAPNNVEELAKKYWPVKVLINSVITIIGTIIWGY
ncbi:MAG: hypothetical protein JXQ77_04010, partial [Campylobacterales bacterium]|nr:hypothetical protein [Campylobacterales bacterium]